MNYGNAPHSVNAGLTAVPTTGAFMGSVWLILAGLTLIMLAFAVGRMLPKQES